MRALVIRITSTDDSDLEWLRNRLVGGVEDRILDEREDGHLDGETEVTWEYED